jgi:hypothetical protein
MTAADATISERVVEVSSHSVVMPQQDQQANRLAHRAHASCRLMDADEQRAALFAADRAQTIAAKARVG